MTCQSHRRRRGSFKNWPPTCGNVVATCDRQFLLNQDPAQPFPTTLVFPMIDGIPINVDDRVIIEWKPNRAIHSITVNGHPFVQ